MSVFLDPQTPSVFKTVRVSGINLTSTAITDLYTVPSGKIIIPVNCSLRYTTINTVTGQGAVAWTSSGGRTFVNGVFTSAVGAGLDYSNFIVRSENLGGLTSYILPAGDVAQFNLFAAFTATTLIGEVFFTFIEVDA